MSSLVPFRPCFVRSLLVLFLAISSLAATAHSEQHPTQPDIVKTGVIHGSQNHSYVEVPFSVPAGLSRVTLTYAYTARDQHTAIDLGLLDSKKLRCWSGGNKSMLTIGLTDATPSCLPGPLPAGTWNVLLGVPNIRAGVTTHYTIKIYFSHTGEVSAEPSVLLEPLRQGPAWYRGDLHMHTAHSDGQCPSQTGKRVPCPVFLTVEAAAKRGLDFIAITDHNAQSQYDAMRELQPYFDKVLLIPGREITTFYGHMNLLGTTAFLDFRLGSKTVPNVDTLAERADKLGAVFSINHPDAPTGERCMGCGWTPPSPVNMNLFAAVEAVNGGSELGGYNGVPFWNKQLDRGYRLTGIGGSDNHNALEPPDRFSSVGSPTTVVFAQNLSEPAILAGIRAGHVFIDLTGSRNRMLEMTATDHGTTADMGDLLRAPQGTMVQFAINATGANGGKVELVEDGNVLPTTTGESRSTQPGSASLHRVQWPSDGQRHWFRPQVVGPKGNLWLLGNPVYVNWTSQAD